MTTRARAGTTTAILACVLALSACDDGGGTTRVDFVRQANAVCRTNARQIAVLEIPGRADVGSMPRAASEVVAVQRRSLDRLRDLEPPKQDREQVEKWIALVDQTLDQAELSANSQRDGDIQRAIAANANGASLDRRADAIAKRYGMTACVRAATPPPEPAATTSSTTGTTSTTTPDG
jgi:hypothetical protein